MMVDPRAILHIILYMVCSSGIMFANKLILTVYRFPSFMGLALLQTLFTFILLRLFFVSDIQKREPLQVIRTVFPLSFCYAVDITMGIAGTGTLSLPLFSALRRISNFFILIGEQIILGTVRPLSVYITVGLMVLGAAVAALGDITFDPLGYTFVFINNFSTAGKALLSKSRLRDKGYSSVELLYYNSAFMIPFLLIVTALTSHVFQIINFGFWTNPIFILYFIFSCCSAVLLNYSMLQCTHYTSALTASIVGVIKNIIVTYAGMFIGGDYVFTPTNFIGVTISAVASAMYVAATYRKQPQESGVEVAVRKVESTVLSVPVVQDKEQAG
ncbi:Formyl-coenzyme A transferase, variant 2 [Clonorchis sinensis]|nr:Formyl-coenzyme A transferase, variant 2 [Clonorchis sinensis]